MATPTETRRIMKKVYYYQIKLQEALTEAHTAKIIVYDHDEEGSYHKHAPCSPAYESRQRVDKTTQKQLAEAMKKEIMRGIK